MEDLKKKYFELYDLNDDWSVAQFSFVNPTGLDVTLNIFDPTILFEYPTKSALIGLPPVFYISGSTNYNNFIRDILNSPAWVRRIVFYSNTDVNFNQVLNQTYTDANGIQVNVPRIPSLSIGISQFQTGIGMVDFKDDNFVLGINEFFSNFFVGANSQITLILIYNQIEKSSLLSDKTKLMSTLDLVPEPVQVVGHKDLENGIPFDYIPTISEKAYMNKGKNLIKPFDFVHFYKIYKQSDG